MYKYLFLGLILSIFLPPSVMASGQVNTFIYHRFDESKYPSTNISSEIFKQQLDYLRDNNIEVISLGETVTRLESGQPLPDHAVALCADDSYKSFYDVAMPLVREYGYPITLFVNTAAVGSGGYLSWDDLRQLHEEGVELGNHTATHPYLVEAEDGETYSQWRERIRLDIQRSQEAFERNLGFRPDLFAYTYGEYSDDIVELIKEMGFRAAYAQQSGVVSTKNQLYNLPRFPMGGPFATLKGFVNKYKMTSLDVISQEPFNPVIGTDNPPTLRLKFDKSYNVKRFNCFVQGDNSCKVEKDGDGWIKVTAEKPLTGRRNKYTLTLQTREGKWAWFSQPWINADNPVRSE